MAVPCVKPLPLYRPRDPRASDLWSLIDEHYETFQQVYDERFQAKYGFWRPVIHRSVAAFLKPGHLLIITDACRHRTVRASREINP